MKPTTNNGNENPSKGSLSKSMKKSSKSRSKLSKAATSSIQASLQQTTNAQEAATPTTIQDLPKEKAHHKCYAGFGPKSIKTIWEQHDTSDTEIAADVYTRLSEDVTYRVWELISTIKTYARHSGGRVTADLVNEVLKDSDIPPALGAADTEWDKIEYDGNFFFNSDHILELRDEYLKEIRPFKVYESDVVCIKSGNVGSLELYKEFVKDLYRSVFLGNDEAYKHALNVAASAAQIGSSLKLILIKCIETLAFKQDFKVTERFLQLLKSLSMNSYTRNVECNEQLFHLSEILVCILMGTYDSIKPPLVIKTEKKEESFELVKNFLENSDQEIKKEIVNFNQMDVDDIRNEYEALFQMMERDGFQEHNDSETPSVDEIKVTNVMGPPQPPPPLQSSTSSSATSEIIKNLQTNQQVQLKQEINESTSTYDENILRKIKQEDVTEEKVDEEEGKEDEGIKEKEIEEIQVLSDIFSPCQAEMCDFKDVDLVTSTLGYMSSQFGYFQKECIFLIQKRMEKFFNQRETICDTDFKFISRCVRGLISLGDYAFREMIPFLNKINSLHAPETIYNDFSPAAIFLKGEDDIFLYEWLEDLCGDRLLPFNLYSFKYHQKLMTKLYNSLKGSTYKIYPKVFIKRIEKKKVNNDDKITNKYFPDMKIVEQTKKIIDFKFAGCKPINIKLKSVKEENMEQANNTIFNSKVVIGKRKLLKILTDKKKIINISNYCFLQI